MNVTDLVVRFKNYALHERGMRAASCKAILVSVRDLCQFANSENIRDLQTGTIREYLRYGREEKLWGAKTYRNRLQQLRSFFEWCVREQYTRSNPTKGIEKPRLPARLPRCLTHDQLQVVLNTVRWMKWTYNFSPIRNEALLSTFAFTGLRLSELLNLEMSDVNLSEGEILVRQGKNRKDRIVPIHPRLKRILENYLAEKKKRLPPSRWFFTSIRSSKQLGQKNIQQLCERVSQEAGIKFTPHMLRHTFARLLIDQDFNLYKLKEILGHADVSTTQIYLSLSQQGIKQSFSKMSL